MWMEKWEWEIEGDEENMWDDEKGVETDCKTEKVAEKRFIEMRPDK